LLSLKNIKLSTRTALLFGSGLLMILGMSILLTRFFFLHEINALELKATIAANRQAQQTIQIKLDDMARRSGDWAFWDETFELLTLGDADYYERNLNADSLKINDVDLMVFLSRNGDYVEGAQLNATADRSDPLSPALLTELLSAQGMGPSLQQLLKTPRPVLKSVAGIISLRGTRC
jgi:sensor domain CHASE-containing protein